MSAVEKALTTRTSTMLLNGLTDPANSLAWNAYVQQYRPVIVRCARSLGLNADAAEDAAQQALGAFSDAYLAGQYDRTRGRLRDWMFGIAYRQIRNYRRRGPRRLHQIDDPATLEPADAVNQSSEARDVWNDQWQRIVLQQCLGRVQLEVEPRTMEAFELFAVRGMPAEQVGKQLDMTANAVFSVKRRILRRLRELAEELETM